jgi:hypothetical protein
LREGGEEEREERERERARAEEWGQDIPPCDLLLQPKLTIQHHHFGGTNPSTH